MSLGALLVGQQCDGMGILGLVRPAIPQNALQWFALGLVLRPEVWSLDAVGGTAAPHGKRINTRCVGCQ